MSEFDNTFDDGIESQTFGELPMQKMKLIGIAGKARSGKDTAATYLLNTLGADWYSASIDAQEMKLMDWVDLKEPKA